MECLHDVVLGRHVPDEMLEPVSRYRVYNPKPGEKIGSETIRRGRVYVNWFDPMEALFFRDPGCLELVIARSSGYDHIDVRAAEEAGVIVVNQPEVITEAVAEYAVAGIMAALRMIKPGSEYITRWYKEGWPRHLMGMLLLGRSIGLLGAGRIGQSIAFKLRLLGAGRILYYSRSRKPCLENTLSARRVGIRELFRSSHIVVNSLPFTEATKGLVTADLIISMPRHGIYVNVGRGGTEEPGAVVEAYKAREDLFLVLDVHPIEPLPPGDERLRLAGSPRVIMTPHFAGYSLESWAATTYLALLQARDYLEGSCVWNLVAGRARICEDTGPSLYDAVEIARNLAEK